MRAAPFLTILCNYIPLAEDGQNTRCAAMRKRHASVAQAFSLRAISLPHFPAFASTLPRSPFLYLPTSLLLYFVLWQTE
jgi:hypothetical protein